METIALLKTNPWSLQDVGGFELKPVYRERTGSLQCSEIILQLVETQNSCQRFSKKKMKVQVLSKTVVCNSKYVNFSCRNSIRPVFYMVFKYYSWHLQPKVDCDVSFSQTTVRMTYLNLATST